MGENSNLQEIKFIGFYVEKESKFSISIANKGYYREVKLSIFM